MSRIKVMVTIRPPKYVLSSDDRDATDKLLDVIEEAVCNHLGLERSEVLDMFDETVTGDDWPETRLSEVSL